MEGEEGGFGAGGKGFLFLCFAGGLEGAELGGFALATAGETVFLKREIAQLLFVAAAHFQVEMGLIFGFGPVGGIAGHDGSTADGDDGQFQQGNGGETPTDVRDGLDQGAFFGAYGLKLLPVSGGMAGVIGGVVGMGEQDAGAGEAMLDGVKAGFCFTLGGDGAGGFLRVLAVGGEAGFGNCVAAVFSCKWQAIPSLLAP